jgi:pyruvate kinase
VLNWFTSTFEVGGKVKLRKVPMRSKIVCTIGPACDSKETLLQMSKVGMDVLRLNLSHGTLDEHRERFERIRKHLPNSPILMDLEGPRVRIGEMTEEVLLNEGDQITLTTEKIVGDGARVSVSLKTLPTSISEGKSIFINDGIVELRVDRIKGKDIHCSVISNLSRSQQLNIEMK